MMKNNPRNNRTLAFGLALVLFLLGLGSGLAVGPLLFHAKGGCQGNTPRRRWSPETQAQRYQERLKLDTDQAEEVAQILQERWERTAQVFRQIEPEFDSARREADTQVRSLLRPDQLPLHDAMLQRRAQRHQTMWKSLGNGQRDNPPEAESELKSKTEPL